MFTFLRMLVGFIFIMASFLCIEYVRYGDDKDKVIKAQWFGFAFAFIAGVLIHYALL